MLLEEKFAYIASYLAGEFNQSEVVAFEDWLASDPAHVQLLNEAEVLWKSPLDIPEANSEAAWEKVKLEIKPKVKLLPRLLRAAMIIVLIGLAIGAFKNFNQSPKEAMVIYQSTGIDTLHVLLQDSSRVVLAPNSQLEVKYPWTIKRGMTLSGSAFFEVERDKNRPFEIATNKGIFEVLGTSFFVQTKDAPNQNLLSVKTGRVKFVNNDLEQVEVVKGFAIKNEKAIAVNEIILLDQTDSFWLHKKLFYSNERVSQIVEDLEKLYRTKILTEDAAILNCRFSGKFNNNSLNEIIEIIAFALDLEIENIGQNQFSLKGSGC